MAWGHRNRPAGGHEASGPGWGGPAKGAGRGSIAKAFTVASPTRVTLIGGPRDAEGKFIGQGDPRKMAERKRREMAKEERIADLVETLEDIALDTTSPGPTRVMAADKALDRLAGKPPQTNTNLNVSVFDNLTPAQQRAVVEAIDALGSGEAGAEDGASETHH